jgi:hypothetical protein
MLSRNSLPATRCGTRLRHDPLRSLKPRSVLLSELAARETGHVTYVTDGIASAIAQAKAAAGDRSVLVHRLGRVDARDARGQASPIDT